MKPVTLTDLKKTIRERLKAAGETLVDLDVFVRAVETETGKSRWTLEEMAESAAKECNAEYRLNPPEPIFFRALSPLVCDTCGRTQTKPVCEHCLDAITPKFTTEIWQGFQIESAERRVGSKIYVDETAYLLPRDSKYGMLSLNTAELRDVQPLNAAFRSRISEVTGKSLLICERAPRSFERHPLARGLLAVSIRLLWEDAGEQRLEVEYRDRDGDTQVEFVSVPKADKMACFPHVRALSDAQG